MVENTYTQLEWTWLTRSFQCPEITIEMITIEMMLVYITYHSCGPDLLWASDFNQWRHLTYQAASCGRHFSHGPISEEKKGKGGGEGGGEEGGMGGGEGEEERGEEREEDRKEERREERREERGEQRGEERTELECVLVV